VQPTTGVAHEQFAVYERMRTSSWGGAVLAEEAELLAKWKASDTERVADARLLLAAGGR
jgi:hypothetical protein